MTRALLTGGLPGSGAVPTAIVGFNDWCALGALRSAAALGVAVPAQLSVIGFDNTLLGEASAPRLCSYQPQAFEMGRQAAKLLGAHLRKEVDGPRRVIVPVDFVCRESCGPAYAQGDQVPGGALSGRAPGGAAPPGARLARS